MPHVCDFLKFSMQVRALNFAGQYKRGSSNLILFARRNAGIRRVQNIVDPLIVFRHLEARQMIAEYAKQGFAKKFTVNRRRVLA